jgi:hypothetical protein
MGRSLRSCAVALMVVLASGCAQMAYGILQAKKEADARAAAASGPVVASSVRGWWTAAEYRCSSGRQFHLRCVDASTGKLCFFETDDGKSFDCVDDGCRATPAGVDAWCSL